MRGGGLGVFFYGCVVWNERGRGRESADGGGYVVIEVH